LSAPDNLNYEFGPFLLEPQARSLSRDGESVPLAAPEFELLLLLVRNRGRVVEKSEIMSTVWPGVDVEENNLTVRMSSLRRALGETKGHHPYIQTVTGRGYCLITPVKELPAQPSPAASERIPLPAVSRKWQIRGFRLYALLLIGLLATSCLYAVLRWQRRAPVQSMKMNRVTHTGRVNSAAVSPDGKSIAYVERDGRQHSLWFQRAGTNNPLPLLPGAEVFLLDITFSPDGNTLYYSKCQQGCKLYRMPVMGGVETALPVRADSPVTFSPDGKRMAFVRAGLEGTDVVVRLLVTNSDGTGEESLFSRVGGKVYQHGAAAWSPDGKVIAFPILETEGARSYMKVIGVNVTDRTETTLTAQRWDTIRDVAWLPEGDGLIINARDEASVPEQAAQIWRISYPGGEARRITNDLNNYTKIRVSADGDTLMALEMHWISSLWIAPAENPSSGTQVTPGRMDRRDGNLGLSMSPDNKLIYVSDFNGKRDLWAVNADGTGHIQLTDARHADIGPTVTGDGRYVVFESTREGAHSIWRMEADGRNPLRLTRGSNDVEPTCSLDGKWVVYVSNDGLPPKLWKVSIEGGEPVQLTGEFALHPTFSPDGKVIAYYRMDMEKRERRDIVIIPAEGGAAVKTLPAPKNFGSIMRWSPKGDALIYRDSTLTSLWRLPLDGTPPSAVMNLRSDDLSSFSYSHDGRKLAYASGSNLTDVILITGFN
jgi:Tol biopolymer transport system component/DNA-binding winged helix-turn-helix (wHTH) protein